MTRLRVTLRTLRDDLKLEEAILDEPYEILAEHHPILKAFVERRGQQPTGTETTNLPVSIQTVFNLHFGRYRGLTWHDEEDDVVWLLGVGWHEEGSRDDAYAYLKGLDVDDRLMPDADDYERLYRLSLAEGPTSFADLFKEVIARGPTLRESAAADPGTLHEVDLAGVLIAQVRVTEESDGATFTIVTYEVRFQMPPRQPGVLPSGDEWQALLVPAFLPPDADVTACRWDFSAGSIIAIYEDLIPF